jgi:uncharacterized membrane protein YfcA
VPSFPVFLVMLAAMVGGSTLQGSVGFGQNLVVVPIVAIVAPDALPGTLIVAGLPLSVLMAKREWHGIDRRGLAWITVGRVPGTILGAAVVALVSADALGGIAGGIVVAAVVISILSPPIPVTATSAATVGAAAGALGTTAAIEGPPQALLYQHHPGATLRSTLAASFVIGSVMSLVALVVAGEITGWQMVLAVGLVPGVLLGLRLSRPLSTRLHGRSLRPLVLTIAASTGAVAILRAVL